MADESGSEVSGSECVETFQESGPPRKPGIIYLSRVPPYMSVAKARNVFEQYGEVGKIFFQPEKEIRKGKKVKLFTEGWVEFKKKKLAKKVAMSLHGQRVGDKKKSRWYDEVWSIKYLHRFLWAHLNEKSAYEKTARRHRMAAEIAQAKREADFYIDNVEKQQRKNAMDKRAAKKSGTAVAEGISSNVGVSERVKLGSGEGGTTDGKSVRGDIKRPFEFRQKDTEDDVIAKKKGRKEDGGSSGEKSSSAAPLKPKGNVKLSRELLNSVFTGGAG